MGGRELRIPVDVVIKHDGVGDAGVEVFCAAGLPMLRCDPFERHCQRGRTAASLLEIRPTHRTRFRARFAEIVK